MDDKLTTKDAITVLRNLQDWLYLSGINGGTKIHREAIDVAIGALKQPEIVRCKDCLYQRICSWKLQGAKFCSFAEKREVTE